MNDADTLALALSGKTADAIRAEILARLKERMRNMVPKILGSNGKPTKAALQMQMEFIVGAVAGLQAVFGDEGAKTLNSIVPPWWIIASSVRGELLVEPYKSEAKR